MWFERMTAESVLYIVVLLHMHLHFYWIFLKMSTTMSTENLQPVVTAAGPPTATAGGTVLHVPADVAVFDQEFLDKYELDV